ncbi:MAG: glycine cleavage system aminomethyltransferase GcvT [Oligoflexus sp.]
MAENLQKTALYEAHKQLKARMVPFGGWSMPIQYEGVIAEHHKVRQSCGIFDVSHMGELRVKGSDATAFLQYATVNDVTRLANGGGQYTAMLNHEGGMVDDLILYRLTDDDYLLCVNAANTEKDEAWLRGLLTTEACSSFQLNLSNESAQWSQIAVQGPTSPQAMKAILDSKYHEALEALGYMKIIPVNLFGEDAWLARTGYTGEAGYEIYLPNAVAVSCWEALLEKGGAAPIGLGARDTLRLEACYLLYGNDMDDHVSPIEAGISWAVKADKGEFVGKKRVLQDLDPKFTERRKMLGFLLTEKGIPRAGMDIFKDGVKIGSVTSGSYLPTLDGAGGMALISKNGAGLDDNVEIDIRGKRKLAKIVKRPLYSPKVK